MSDDGRDEIHARGMEVRAGRARRRARRPGDRAHDAVHGGLPGPDHPLRVGRDLVAPGARPPHAQLHHADGAVALGREHELEMHVRAALRNGLTPDEIGEVLLQCAVYCGVPAANGGLRDRAAACSRASTRGGGAMSTYVLIHGAWHDGSCWDDVAGELRAAGHDVHAPTLAGQGRGDVDRSVGHADAVASAADAIVGADLRDIVLVGHSYGGTIVSKLAEQLHRADPAARLLERVRAARRRVALRRQPAALQRR